MNYLPRLYSELSGLSNLLTPILNSLKQILKKEEVREVEGQITRDGDLDIDLFKELLIELKVLLEASDFDAVKKVEELKKIQGIGKYTENIKKINEFISDYEFDESVRVVNKLIKNV